MQESQTSVDDHSPEQQPAPNSKSKNTKTRVIAAVVILILVLSTVIFVLLKNNGGLIGSNDAKKQYPIDCKPKDENQWYRTDSTFVINPKNPDEMYVNIEYKGFYKSTDGGKTWIKKVNGIFSDHKDEKTGEPCYTEYPAAVIDPTNPQRLLLATAGSPGTLKDPNSRGGGIYETTNGGDSWQQKITTEMNAYSTPSLVFDPKDPNTYYYGTTSAPASYDEADQSITFVKKGLIYQTKDNGANWQELPTGLVPNARLTKIFIDPSNTNKITAATAALDRAKNGPSALSAQQMGMIQSLDGGKTWNRLGSLPAGYEAVYEGDMSSNNGNNMFVISVTQGNSNKPKSFYSLNGGTTFSQSSQSMDLAEYDPNDPSGKTIIGYAWQTEGPPATTLFKSTDAGKTWVAFGKLPKEITNVMDPKTRIQNIVWHPTDPNTFFMTGSGGLVWKTTDGGQTWTKLLSYDAVK